MAFFYFQETLKRVEAFDGSYISAAAYHPNGAAAFGLRYLVLLS